MDPLEKIAAAVSDGIKQRQGQDTAIAQATHKTTDRRSSVEVITAEIPSRWPIPPTQITTINNGNWRDQRHFSPQQINLSRLPEFKITAEERAIVDKLADEVADNIRQQEYFSKAAVEERWKKERAEIGEAKPRPEEREQWSVSLNSRLTRAAHDRQELKAEGLEKMAEVRPVITRILERFVAPLEALYNQECEAAAVRAERYGMSYRLDDVTWAIHAELQKLKSRVSGGFSKDALMSPWHMLAPFVVDETPSPTQ